MITLFVHSYVTDSYFDLYLSNVYSYSTTRIYPMLYLEQKALKYTVCVETRCCDYGHKKGEDLSCKGQWANRGSKGKDPSIPMPLLQIGDILGPHFLLLNETPTDCTVSIIQTTLSHIKLYEARISQKTFGQL